MTLKRCNSRNDGDETHDQPVESKVKCKTIFKRCALDPAERIYEFSNIQVALEIILDFLDSKSMKNLYCVYLKSKKLSSTRDWRHDFETVAEVRVRSNASKNLSTCFALFESDQSREISSLIGGSKLINRYLAAVGTTAEQVLDNRSITRHGETARWLKLLIAEHILIFGKPEAAGRLGHPEAQSQYAMMFMHGRVKNITKQFEKCIEWLVAAAPVHPMAMFCLGTTIAFPNDQMQTPKFAVEMPIAEHDAKMIQRMYEVAAHNGVHAAMVNLGMFHYGKFPGVASNISLSVDQAMYWWKQAARYNQVEALLNLGHVYMRGTASIVRDPKEACKCFALAADQGRDPRAQFLYGRALLEGNGVPQNLVLARCYLEKAAWQSHNEQVSANAQYLLAEIDVIWRES